VAETTVEQPVEETETELVDIDSYTTVEILPGKEGLVRIVSSPTTTCQRSRTSSL